MFTIVLATAATGMVWLLRDGGIVLGRASLPWWVVAALFAAAEVAVMHLRFRRDAHSFNMGEIALVLGLFVVSPASLIAAQAVGILVVLAGHRRQPVAKLAFNVAQFGIRTGLAILVFRVIVGTSDPLGPAGWAAAAAASLTALAAGDTMINVVIRMSGGRPSWPEVFDVLGLRAIAALMNTALGLVGVIVLSTRPEATWLAVAPPVILLIAYRAYMSQRQEGARLEALYDTTRALHASPQIEAAMAAAVWRAREIFDAEYAEVAVFPEQAGGVVYRTSAGPGTTERIMAPAGSRAAAALWRLATHTRGAALGSTGHPLSPNTDLEVRDAITARLMGNRGVIGVVLVANRLGDVRGFSADDVKLLETISSQVAVSLENGRLEDSLAQLTTLKERLEQLVRSKDEFVASVSHELRTPLTAVLGLTHELQANRSAFSDEEQNELMEVVAEQSAELSDIVEDLLVAARADIGTLNLHRVQCDLRTELATVMEGLGRNHPETVSDLPVSGMCRPAFADTLRVRQIVRNLLTNAVRYGGTTIRVEFADVQDMSTITVVDSGQGVPDAQRESIFEPYERAHNAVGQPASVGLGLAVSRKLARLLGGDLTYRHHDGWTGFTLALPQAEESGLAEAS